MEEKESVKKCKDCNKLLRHWNKSGYCSVCYNRSIWKTRYDELKAEFEQHMKLCRLVHLDLWNRLKKHEPELTWDEEPE